MTSRLTFSILCFHFIQFRSNFLYSLVYFLIKLPEIPRTSLQQSFYDTGGRAVMGFSDGLQLIEDCLWLQCRPLSLACLVDLTSRAHSFRWKTGRLSSDESLDTSDVYVVYFEQDLKPMRFVLHQSIYPSIQLPCSYVARDIIQSNGFALVTKRFFFRFIAFNNR